MDKAHPQHDIDVAFWRESMRLIDDEKSDNTGACLVSDGARFALAAKVGGIWARLDPGDSDGEPGERLDPRYKYYRHLAAFAPLAAALLAIGCTVLDAIGFCPVHNWVF